MTLVFNKTAMEAYEWAVDNGICDDPIEDIIDIVMDQEVVSYCTSKGSVTFDIYDVVSDEDDGQPSEYDEWQDFMGGDDMFETCSYYDDY